MSVLLLVRFVTLVLLEVLLLVIAAVLNQIWLIGLALAVLLVTVLFLVRLIIKYAGASEWLGPTEEAELVAAHLVHVDSGHPAHHREHRWTGRSNGNGSSSVRTAGSQAVPAAWRGPDGAHRVLLVATDPVSVDQLRAVLAPEISDDGLAVLVIAPALSDRGITRSMVHPSEAFEHAEQVALQTVAALRGAGIPASGHVGPTDPASALTDGLRTYAAERVVVARHHRAPLRHHEGDPVENAARAFGVPVQELALDPA